MISDCHTSTGRRGFCTRRCHPANRIPTSVKDVKKRIKIVKKKKRKDTYDVLNILAREMEVGEFHEVVWEGEFSALLEVVSRFSNQIQGQVHHGGSSSILVLLLRTIQQAAVASSEQLRWNVNICFSRKIDVAQNNHIRAVCFALEIQIVRGRKCEKLK